MQQNTFFDFSLFIIIQDFITKMKLNRLLYKVLIQKQTMNIKLSM